MNNLETIVTIVFMLGSVVLIFVGIYAAIRIALHYYIRSQLGDMPSAEEIAELYRQNNMQIRYPFGKDDDTPPL